MIYHSPVKAFPYPINLTKETDPLGYLSWYIDGDGQQAIEQKWAAFQKLRTRRVDEITGFVTLVEFNEDGTLHLMYEMLQRAGNDGYDTIKYEDSYTFKRLAATIAEVETSKGFDFIEQHAMFLAENDLSSAINYLKNTSTAIQRLCSSLKLRQQTLLLKVVNEFSSDVICLLNHFAPPEVSASSSSNQMYPVFKLTSSQFSSLLVRLHTQMVKLRIIDGSIKDFTDAFLGESSKQLNIKWTIIGGGGHTNMRSLFTFLEYLIEKGVVSGTSNRQQFFRTIENSFVKRDGSRIIQPDRNYIDFKKVKNKGLVMSAEEKILYDWLEKEIK